MNTFLSVLSSVIAAVAAVFAGLTWREARRSSKDATVSAAAADRSATAAERSATASEQSAEHQRELARAARAEHHAAYKFDAKRSQSNDLVRVLRLDETSPRAFALKVACSLPIDSGPTEFAVFEPGDEVELTISAAEVQRGKLTLTFKDSAGDDPTELRRTIQLRPPQRVVVM